MLTLVIGTDNPMGVQRSGRFAATRRGVRRQWVEVRTQTMHSGQSCAWACGPVVCCDYDVVTIPTAKGIPTIQRMRGSPSGLMARLTAFVAWIFTAERLETDASEPNVVPHRSGDGAKNLGTFLRTLLATEPLPSDAPPAAPRQTDHGPGRMLLWL